MMLELCTIIAISFGYLDNEKVKVYDLDCKSEIYKTVEIEGELVEVEQKGNILYLKGEK